MKKYLYLLLFAGIVGLLGCTGPDITKPLITLIGGTTDTVIQYSSPTYNDPGATAIDENDATLPITISGSVNMIRAGKYVLIYICTDQNGYSDSKTRTVIVDGAKYLAGNYMAENFTDSISKGTIADVITSDPSATNIVYFTTFAGYNNCNLKGTTADSTLTIPSQTITCGTPAADRTFTGSGVYSRNMTSFTIFYTETANGTSKNHYCIYVRN